MLWVFPSDFSLFMHFLFDFFFIYTPFLCIFHDSIAFLYKFSSIFSHAVYASILDHETIDDLIDLPVFECLGFVIEGRDGSGDAQWWKISFRQIRSIVWAGIYILFITPVYYKFIVIGDFFPSLSLSASGSGGFYLFILFHFNIKILIGNADQGIELSRIWGYFGFVWCCWYWSSKAPV